MCSSGRIDPRRESKIRRFLSIRLSPASISSLFPYLPHGGAFAMVPKGHRNWIEVDHIGQATVAKFTIPTIVSEEKILVIGRELLSLVQQSGRRPIVLNFQGVERVSTELIGQ